MKKTILLLIFIAISIMSYSQENRFEKLFKEADSCFNQDLKLDSVFLIMEDETTIEVTVKELLSVYFTGYINGSLNYKYKQYFDIENLLIELINNKRAIKSYQRFKYNCNVVNK